MKKRFGRLSAGSAWLPALALVGALACGPRADERPETVGTAVPPALQAPGEPLTSFPEAGGFQAPEPAGQQSPGAQTPKSPAELPLPPDVSSGPPQGGEDIPELYVGPVPTADPASWTFVSGNLLLGALKKVDDDSATALSGSQLQQVRQFLARVQEPAAAADQASRTFLGTAQAVLKPRQWWALTAEGPRLAAVNPDFDRLVGALQAKAGGATPAPLASSTPAPSAYGPGELVVALQFLDSYGEAPLEPEQAAALLPVLKDYRARLEALVALYPELWSLLEPKQKEAFVQALAQTKPREIPSPDRVINLEGFQAHLEERLK